MRNSLFIFIFTSLLTTSSSAQQNDHLERAISALEGTHSVIHNPMFEGGKLSGCGLEFSALVRNWQSRNGQYARASGTIGYMSAGGIVAPVLKLVIHEINMQTMALSPKAPTRSYVVSGGKSSFESIVSSYNSDTPGAIFVVFNFSPVAEMYGNALQKGSVALRYGYSESGIDTPLTLDLTVESTDADGKRKHSMNQINEMFVCMKELLDILKK